MPGGGGQPTSPKGYIGGRNGGHGGAQTRLDSLEGMVSPPTINGSLGVIVAGGVCGVLDAGTGKPVAPQPTRSHRGAEPQRLDGKGKKMK